MPARIDALTSKSGETPQQPMSAPKHGFLVLLFSLLSLNIIPAYFPPTERALFLLAIVSCILLVSLYLVVHRKKELVIGALLVVPALITSWWGYRPDDSILTIVNIALTIIFLSYIIFYLVRYLFEADKVSKDMIYASMCVYMMLGLIWAFIYFSIEIINPGSFLLSPEETADEANPRLMLSQFSYYSYVTLSTLGYGDIVPITRVARSWTTIEAIIGQFYLAVVVARLVGLHIISAKN